VRKLITILLLLVPSLSQAWWNDDWNFRKEIALDLTPAGGDIAATATDVPVLLRLSLANFQYFADVKPDGSDFRAIAGDDKTPLKFHVERFDAANQMAFIWVKVPRLPGATNTEKIYLYYGNKDAPAAADAAGSYDANQLMVLHFAEASGNPADVTAYGNSAKASTAELATASLIGGGANFTGAGVITVPATASLRLIPAKGLTLSAWVRVDGEQSDAYVLALEDGAKSLVLGINGLAPFARLSDGTLPIAEVRTVPTLVGGQWHHLAVAAGNGRIVLTVDGVELGSSPATAPEIAGALTIGGSSSGGHFIKGGIDEVQASAVVRPAEWIRAQARSQGQDAALVAYGSDAQREGEKVSYFAVTMKNVTMDGWVVIGILMVMFLVSMLVMIQKAIQLARIQKANKAFLKVFEKMRGDLTQLDRKEAEDDEGDDAIADAATLPSIGGDAGDYKLSTLYRLYHHGVQEIQARTAAQSVGARASAPVLTSQSMEAVKAAMDATLVRMTQSLQSKMVLLTIAISGGPFLGLLGTVVGVMITFAAIAASGDVNVNAIAPGIAAALVATVAGLAVAIPALFGYNWLNTKIKEIKDDMRVFVDEFVTRVAERYA
jgi:biopolymer transport protein ExbB